MSPCLTIYPSGMPKRCAPASHNAVSEAGAQRFRAAIDPALAEPGIALSAEGLAALFAAGGDDEVCDLIAAGQIAEAIGVARFNAFEREHPFAQRGQTASRRGEPAYRRGSTSARRRASRRSSPPQTSAPMSSGKTREKSGDSARRWVATAPPRWPVSRMAPSSALRGKL
jgi:hypothetical protein